MSRLRTLFALLFVLFVQTAGAFGQEGGSDGSSATPEFTRERVEGAIESAVDWLRRHQHPAGYWSAAGFTEQCEERCRNEGDGEPGAGSADVDVGVTALALLTFAGTGHTQYGGRDRERSKAVKAALEWLLAQQQLDGDSEEPSGRHGLIGPAKGDHWEYHHALATMALGELLIMTNDSRLRSPVKAAVEWILDRQVPGSGWAPSSDAAKVDPALTGWMMLALRVGSFAAENRLIRVDSERFEASEDGVKRWLAQAIGPDGRHVDDDPNTPTLTALTTWSCWRLFERPSLRRSIRVLEQHPPAWNGAGPSGSGTVDLCYWYFSVGAVCGLNDPARETIVPAAWDALVTHQRQSGDEKGSWDPVGKWGHIGGRVYSTAMGSLILQNFRRFAPEPEYGPDPIPFRKGSLNERRGFRTTLTEERRNDEPLAKPPSDVFEIVEFPSPVGKLQAYLTPTPKDGEKHAAIIWITGGFPPGGGGEFLWESIDPENDPSARAFREKGVVMMVPALRGTAGNPGKQESFYGEVHDVRAAKRYLSKLESVDPDRIFLGGHDTGATLALLAAASESFAGVFAFGPAADPRFYPEEHLTYDPENEKEARLRAPIHFLDEIESPTWVIEGRWGQWHDLRELDRATDNPQVHFVEVPHANHSDVLYPLHRMLAERVADRATNWAKLAPMDLENAYREFRIRQRRARDEVDLAVAKESGANIATEQALRFHVYSWRHRSLYELAYEAKKLGFDQESIERVSREDEFARFRLTLSRPFALRDFDAIVEASRALEFIGDGSCEYDGWTVE